MTNTFVINNTNTNTIETIDDDINVEYTDNNEQYDGEWIKIKKKMNIEERKYIINEIIYSIYYTHNNIYTLYIYDLPQYKYLRDIKFHFKYSNDIINEYVQDGDIKNLSNSFSYNYGIIEDSINQTYFHHESSRVIKYVIKNILNIQLVPNKMPFWEFGNNVISIYSKKVTIYLIKYNCEDFELYLEYKQKDMNDIHITKYNYIPFYSNRYKLDNHKSVFYYGKKPRFMICKIQTYCVPNRTIFKFIKYQEKNPIVKYLNLDSKLHLLKELSYINHETELELDNIIEQDDYIIDNNPDSEWKEYLIVIKLPLIYDETNYIIIFEDIKFYNNGMLLNHDNMDFIVV